VDNLASLVHDISFETHDSGEELSARNRGVSENAEGAGVPLQDVRRIAYEAISQWTQNDQTISSLAVSVRMNRDFDSGIGLIVNSRISTYMSAIDARLKNLESSRPFTSAPPNFNAFQAVPADGAQYSSATTTRPATGDGSQRPNP
jgi:hypothetical protein